MRVDKDDYDRVLRLKHYKELRDRLKTIRWLPHFRNWTSHAIAVTTKECRLVVYPPNKVSL